MYLYLLIWHMDRLLNARKRIFHPLPCVFVAVRKKILLKSSYLLLYIYFLWFGKHISVKCKGSRQKHTSAHSYVSVKDNWVSDRLNPNFRFKHRPSRSAHARNSCRNAPLYWVNTFAYSSLKYTEEHISIISVESTSYRSFLSDTMG